jgi:beta-phosphoglucomutase-like phosphatase (HAD superfamily)
MNLEISDTARFFDELVCGNDVVNGKPHPEVFLTAAKRLGAKPENCLAYEDSINGIKSAYSAGMVTVMVPDYIAPTEEIMPMISFLCDDLAQSIEKIEPLLA